MRISFAEHDRGGGHGSSCLSGEIRPGIILVDLESSPGRRHVLRPLPAVVISVAIADLQKSHHFIPFIYRQKMPHFIASRACSSSPAPAISAPYSITPHDSIVAVNAIGRPNFTWSPAS
nr:hypothetical protein Iba_chr04eCG8590 [Ipomoea batatas]